MPSVLFTASTFSHIISFHLPYLRRFRELGWQVDVACGGAMRDIPFADAVVAQPLEKKISAPSNFRAASLLRRRMEREHYDLVVTHTTLAAFFTRWAMRGMRTRPRVVDVVHGYLFDDGTQGLKRLLLTEAERLTAPQTDLLLTMNAWDTQWAAAHHAAARVEEIPGMGVDLSRFQAVEEKRQAMREKLGLAEQDVALIYPAEFGPRKDQATLLRAMPLLPQRVKLLLPGRVILPECVHKLPDWLAAADISVSSSWKEGLPFHIMEAMACGLPAVVTAIKGHTDLVGPENGLLVPCRDENAFAAAIQKLADQPSLRARLGEAGRRKVQRYGLETVLPQVMERYLSVLDGGK